MSEEYNRDHFMSATSYFLEGTPHSIHMKKKQSSNSSMEEPPNIEEIIVIFIYMAIVF